MGAGMIYTGRYQYKHLSDTKHRAIRTTRGAPRFQLSYTLHKTLWEIAPPREAFGLPLEAFREVYFAHLDAVGVERIIALLDAEERLAKGRPVVLLCFCGDDHEFCHRWLFAEWFEREAGVRIDELPAP